MFQVMLYCSGLSTREPMTADLLVISQVRRCGSSPGRSWTSLELLDFLWRWVSNKHLRNMKIKLLFSGWYLIALGFWSMLYDPIHFAAFMIILFLLPVLLYTSYVLYGLYLMLSEAYIDVSILEYSSSSSWLMISSCFSLSCHVGGRNHTLMKQWMTNTWTSGEYLFESQSC